MKILVIPKQHLGDVILTTPLLEVLKRKHPECQLWLGVDSLGASLISRDRRLAGVLILDPSIGFWEQLNMLKAQKFDRVYCLSRSFRRGLLLFLSGIQERIGPSGAFGSWFFTQRFLREATKHEVLRNLAALGVELTENDSQVSLSLPRLELKDLPAGAQTDLARLQSSVLVFPGSKWATKRWHWERYRELAGALASKGLQVVIMGQGADADLCRDISRDLPVVNLCGQLDLESTSFLVSQAALVVCNDSMALHMAAAFQRPTVAVFCATSPSFGFGPWRNRAMVVEKLDLPCKPCSRHGSTVCPTGTWSCMRDLSAASVLKAAQELGALS